MAISKDYIEDIGSLGLSVCYLWDRLRGIEIEQAIHTRTISLGRLPSSRGSSCSDAVRA